MYRSHYKLKEKPFQISPDPKFLWLGEKHKEALATMKYGILGNKGFMLLTGDAGTGKTTLINTLVNSLDEEIIVATVPDPGLDNLDFYNFISNVFGIKGNYNSKGPFLLHFSQFLNQAYADNKKVLLIIDEAQRLSQDLLEEIRLLSNIEKENTKLLNIFFVGQNEFNDILKAKVNKALKQRIPISYNIEPLSENEIGEYIRSRLKVAGSEENIFSSEAIHEIFLFSCGLPRLINIICDHALLTGYVKGAKKINLDIIKECKKELKISHQQIATDNNEDHTKKETEFASELEKPDKSKLIKLHSVKKVNPILNDYSTHNFEETQRPSHIVKKIGLILATLLLILSGYLYYMGSHTKYLYPLKNTWEQVIEGIKNLSQEPTRSNQPKSPRNLTSKNNKTSSQIKTKTLGPIYSENQPIPNPIDEANENLEQPQKTAINISITKNNSTKKYKILKNIDNEITASHMPEKSSSTSNLNDQLSSSQDKKFDKGSDSPPDPNKLIDWLLKKQPQKP